MTEHELIKGCVKNNATCQRMLFEQYARKMMTICIRYSFNQAEAEDMLQEAFVRIFSFINQYKFEGSFEGWLKRIVVNTALRILQKKVIHFSDLDEELQFVTNSDPDVLSNLNEQEILKLVSNLPTGYRVVFNLYVLEGIAITRLLKCSGLIRGQAEANWQRQKEHCRNKLDHNKKLHR